MLGKIEAIIAHPRKPRERFIYVNGQVYIEDIVHGIVGESCWYDTRRLANAINATCADESWITFWSGSAQVGEMIEV